MSLEKLQAIFATDKTVVQITRAFGSYSAASGNCVSALSPTLETAIESLHIALTESGAFQPEMTLPEAYQGTPPTNCDACARPITRAFIDGATRIGPWGNLCPVCHDMYGRGLGTGKGQKYERADDGKFYKVAG